MAEKSKRLGDILVESGTITEEQLRDILILQKGTNKKVGELLIQEGYITEARIIEVLEFQLGIPHVDLDLFYIDPEIPRLINESLARRHMLIPIKKDHGKIVVAMMDPLNMFAKDDVQITTGFVVEPVIATAKQINAAIEHFYNKQRAETAVEEFKKKYVDEAIEEDEESIDDINNAPIVKLLNSIITQAVKSRASDIHLEPFEEILRVRFRVDGELYEVMTPSIAAHGALVTRIKIMGKMDIAEKRVPQDGRVETNIDGKDIDLRISTLPTVFGEKIVIRILDRSGFIADKSQLGFTSSNMALFNKIIQSTYGIILVTGPTGSGKSTTLYSMLTDLNSVNKNIITVEDPVEYKMSGVNQVQVNLKAGLTFANGLKSILRQDPDVIMIGEIRDSETANIAVSAAITGHVVLSTMHTNDAPSTISRLLDMGVEPFLVANALIGVISQRLVRRICHNCKISYEPNLGEQKFLNIEPNVMLHKGKGCKSCSGTGYKGRIAIHEVMPVTKELRHMINANGSQDDIKDVAKLSGTIPLKENCRDLVLEGITTVDEMIKVAYSID